MKTVQSAGQLAVAILSLSSLASAWPSWPRWLPEVDSLVARAPAAASSSSSATQTASSSSSTSTFGLTTTNLNTAGLSSSTTGTDSNAASSTGSSTSGSGSGAASSTSNNSSATTHTTYSAVDGAGGITMLTPAATVTTPLYRIGDYVTWVWNYTSLQGTPTAIDLLVSCSTASETWTLTQNMTFQTPGSYTWDTGAYQSSAIASPLLTEMYTMIIFDADSSISATAEAGYLSVYSGFTFGMYTPKPYTPLPEWNCAVCSGAMTEAERRGVTVVVLTSIITVLSFTWFVVGFGAWA